MPFANSKYGAIISQLYSVYKSYRGLYCKQVIEPCSTFEIFQKTISLSIISKYIYPYIYIMSTVKQKQCKLLDVLYT